MCIIKCFIFYCDKCIHKLDKLKNYFEYNSRGFLTILNQILFKNIYDVSKDIKNEERKTVKKSPRKKTPVKRIPKKKDKR